MFPNAAAGVKKIYTAEILSLIAAVLGFFASIAFLAFSGAAGTAIAEDEISDAAVTGMVAGGALTVVLGIGVAVLTLIAFILKLIGINKAKLDEPYFNSAFIFVLVGIGVSVLAAIFTSSETLNGIFSAVSNIASLCVTICIIKGIINVAKRSQNNALADKGTSVLKLIAAVYIISIISNLLSAIFKSSQALQTIAGILGLIAGVVAVVYYFIYLSLLSKAKKEIS